MKASANRESIDEILSYFDKIKTVELAMESLPNKFVADWREWENLKEKRECLGAEITQLSEMLKNLMHSNSIRKITSTQNLCTK